MDSSCVSFLILTFLDKEKDFSKHENLACSTDISNVFRKYFDKPSNCIYSRCIVSDSNFLRQSKRFQQTWEFSLFDRHFEGFSQIFSQTIEMNSSCASFLILIFWDKEKDFCQHENFSCSTKISTLKYFDKLFKLIYLAYSH